MTQEENIFTPAHNGPFWYELKERIVLKTLQEHNFHRGASAARLGVSTGLIRDYIRSLKSKGIDIPKHHKHVRELQHQGSESCQTPK